MDLPVTRSLRCVHGSGRPSATATSPGATVSATAIGSLGCNLPFGTLAWITIQPAGWVPPPNWAPSLEGPHFAVDFNARCSVSGYAMGIPSTACRGRLSGRRRGRNRLRCSIGRT